MFYKLFDWHNKSFFFKYFEYGGLNGMYYFYNKKGDEAHERIVSWIDISEAFPVTYTDFIDICFLYSGDTQLTILRTWIGNHSYAENRWARRVNILKDGRAKYDVSIAKKDSNLWTFRFDVLEYSGEKHSHDLVIDVESGEIQSLSE